MKKDDNKRNRVTKRLRWIARIWVLPIIVYALVFFIGYLWSWITTGVADPYAVEGTPFREALPPIFMFVSILGLGLAWRWERLGGLIAVIFQLATLIMLCINTPITGDFPRSGIPYLMLLVIVVPGILFLVCWRRSVKARPVDIL